MELIISVLIEDKNDWTTNVSSSKVNWRMVEYNVRILVKLAMLCLVEGRILLFEVVILAEDSEADAVVALELDWAAVPKFKRLAVFAHNAIKSVIKNGYGFGGVGAAWWMEVEAVEKKDWPKVVGMGVEIKIWVKMAAAGDVEEF